MDEVLARHFAAEANHDMATVLDTLTDDVEHDVVGWRDGPSVGLEALRPFYEQLFSGVVDLGRRSLGERSSQSRSRGRCRRPRNRQLGCGRGRAACCRVGAEHDRVLVDHVVHQVDLRCAVVEHADATDRGRSEQLPAVLLAEARSSQLRPSITAMASSSRDGVWRPSARPTARRGQRRRQPPASLLAIIGHESGRICCGRGLLCGRDAFGFAAVLARSSSGPADGTAVPTA
jgi:hypothetical protein